VPGAAGHEKTTVHSILADILALIALSVVLVAALGRLSLPPILGYLCVGVVVGPHALALVGNNETVGLLAEIGVAFLLFTIGLEFSLPQFMEMRRILLGLGGAQVLLGTVSGAAIAWAIGIPGAAAVVVGGALSMSSTAIVIKQLTDQAELQARHGRLSLGVLLFQDLAAVPFLVVIPILAAGTEGMLAKALAIAFLKAVLAVAGMLAAGHFVLRPLFHVVAAARSSELFTLAVLFVSLLAAWVTELLGLSLALGAFLAGMMLSESEYRHQIEAELRPFRDVLLGLFFITVGMRLDLAALPAIWPWVLLIAAGLVIGKGCAIVLLAWAWGRDPSVALRTGVVLGHGGEFGFALLALALATGLIGSVESQPILAGIIISMLFAPVLIRHNRSICERVLPPKAAPVSTDTEELAEATRGVRDHCVLCGYGRVGSQIGKLLTAEDIPFVAIDLDPAHVRSAWEDGKRVFYGDVTHREVLQALGVARARILVVSFDSERAAIHVLREAQAVNPALPILVRSRDDGSLERLLGAGATEVVPETLETSLMLTTRLMHILGFGDERIDARIEALREDRYLMLRDL